MPPTLRLNVAFTTLILAFGATGEALAAPLFGTAPLSCLSNATIEGCTTFPGNLDGASSIAVSPDGRNAYATNVTADTLVTFGRNETTGALSPLGCLSNAARSGCVAQTGRLDSAVSVAIDPSGTSVYVASQSSDTVTLFTRNAGDGSLTPAGCWSNAPRSGCTTVAGLLDLPASVVVSPDDSDVYVASLNSAALVAFSRDGSTGSLTRGGCYTAEPTNGCTTVGAQLDGPSAVAVSPGGTAVYVTAYFSAAVVGFTRDVSTGSLLARECFSNATLAGCGTLAGKLEDATGVATSADGVSVLATSPTSDTVLSFPVTPGTGLLAQPTCFSNAALGDCTVLAGKLDGASAVAVAPDGASAYVAGGDPGGTAGTVTAFTRTGSQLSFNGCYSAVVLSGCSTLSGQLADASGLALSADGANLYAAASGSDAVLSFTREVPPQCRPTSSSGATDAAQALPLDCSDANGDPLSYEVTRGPSHGTLDAVDTAGRTVRYLPAAGYAGVDEVGIRAVADGTPSEPTTVSVMVVASPPPVLSPAPSVAGAPAEAAAPVPATTPPTPKVAAAPPAVVAIRVRYEKRSVTLRRGRSLTLRYRSNRRGRATLSVRRGGKTLLTMARRATNNGTNELALSAKGSRRLKPGRYVLRLTFVSAAGTVFRDDIVLTIKR